MTTTCLCKQCGRPGELRGNETYCDACGPGVELVAVPDGSRELMCKVGRKAAGRMLDGRTWDEFPNIT